MNFENWIPIIYESKKKKRKEQAFSSSSSTPKLIIHPNPARTQIYGIVCWVKYLVDSPENIWGCLNESMFVVVAHHEPVHAFEPETECLRHDPQDPNHGPMALSVHVRELQVSSEIVTGGRLRSSSSSASYSST